METADNVSKSGETFYNAENSSCFYGEDEYNCGLSSELQATAKTDLFEDEKVRQRSLADLRTWIKEHPNIKRCCISSNFLLRFLRLKKFDLDETKKVLVKFLKMKTENPEWFKDLDVLDPKLSALFDLGYIFPLPERDEDGRTVIFVRTAQINPDNNVPMEVVRAMYTTFETLLLDEENQVSGFSYVFDMKDTGLYHLSGWTAQDARMVINCSEKSLPMRHRQIFLMNLSFTLWTILEFIKSLLTEKIRSRLHLLSDQKKLVGRIPTNILPKEYGGKVPISDIMSQWKQKMVSMRDLVLGHDDLEYREPETKKYSWSVSGCLRSLHIW